VFCPNVQWCLRQTGQLEKRNCVKDKVNIMIESDHEEIKAHLAKLENQNKRIKFTGIILAIIMLAVFMLLYNSQSSGVSNVFKELKAERIMVVDSDGETQIGMTISGSRPVIYIKDSNGKTGLLMSANDGETNGGYISILNNANHEAIRLSADEEGNGVVSVYNREGTVKELKVDAQVIE